MSQQNPQPGQQVQIDGSKEITLRLSTSSVAFLMQLLGAQTTVVVTQAGQQGLLAEMDKQLSTQHGLRPAEGTAPAGEAQPLPAANRAQRRRAK